MRSYPQLARRLFLASALAPLVLAACDRAAPPPPAPAAPAQQPAAAPPTPLQPPVVDRSELLSALDAAASAFASGRPDDGAALNGRRYSVRQAFGCGGPAPASAPHVPGVARWAWGRRNQTIELALHPADWTSDLGSGAADAPEAIEGVWLPRPWMRDDGCPSVSTTPPPPPPEASAPGQKAASPARSPPSAPAAPDARQTAGLASVFAQGASRVGRRDGRAFTYTIRGENGPPPAPAAGYRLVIEGRFTAFPGGQTVRCRAQGPDERPVCIAASTIDRVVFESSDGQQLSEWRPG